MSYETPPLQTLLSRDYKDYTIRCIVAGTRHYDNMREFHETVCDQLREFDAPVLFISGAASTGADDLIIRWCRRFSYPCLEMPANWNTGKGAGYARNEEMAKLATHLLAFYDGQSPGTQHMIDCATKHHLAVRTLRVKIAS
jgi:hypothetical protein